MKVVKVVGWYGTIIQDSKVKCFKNASGISTIEMTREE